MISTLIKIDFLIKKAIQVVDNIFLKPRGMRYIVYLNKYPNGQRITFGQLKFTIKQDDILYESHINMGTYSKPIWAKVKLYGLNKEASRYTSILSCKKFIEAYKGHKNSFKINEDGFIIFNRDTVSFHEQLMNS